MFNIFNSLRNCQVYQNASCSIFSLFKLTLEHMSFKKVKNELSGRKIQNTLGWCHQESQQDIDYLNIPHLHPLETRYKPQMAKLKQMTEQGTCLFSGHHHDLKTGLNSFMNWQNQLCC